MEHIDAAYTSLNRYFDILQTTGTYPRNKTRRLLAYSFLVDAVLEGPLSIYLDNRGLAVINRLLSCLRRDQCLVGIPPGYIRLSEPRGSYSEVRLSEEDAFRESENDTIRIKS